MKSQGEIEAVICEKVSRLQRDFWGRGPNEICSHLFNSLLIVHIRGSLMPFEKHLNDRVEIIKQFRSQTMILLRPNLSQIISENTDTELVSLHHDISTVTGEELIVFSLNKSPSFRQSGKNNTKHNVY